MTPAYLPMGDQQLLDGLSLAGRGIEDGLHVQFLQVLMLLVPPAPGCVCMWVHMCARSSGMGVGVKMHLPRTSVPRARAWTRLTVA